MVRTGTRRYRRQALMPIVITLLGVLGDRAIAQVKSTGSATPAKSAPGDELIGEWWTENNEGRIRMTRDRDGSFRGTTTCCVPDKPTPDHPAQDIHNPNPKQRSRSTVGIVLIWKLNYEGDGEYADGYVYNPRDGKTYRIDMDIVDRNTVKIRGYIGIPLLGQSQVWRRVHPVAQSAPKKK